MFDLYWGRVCTVLNNLARWPSKQMKWSKTGQIYSFIAVKNNFSISVVQSLSHVRLFATTWTATPQASLSFNISWSLLKIMSIVLVMPSNHLILCQSLLLFPSIFPSLRVFPMSWLFASGGQSIGASASASVLPMNILDWFSLGLTGWISLLSKGLSRVFYY